MQLHKTIQIAMESQTLKELSLSQQMHKLLLKKKEKETQIVIKIKTENFFGSLFFSKD